MFYSEIRNSVRKNLSNRVSGVEEAGKRKLLNEFMQLRKVKMKFCFQAEP